MGKYVLAWLLCVPAFVLVIIWFIMHCRADCARRHTDVTFIYADYVVCRALYTRHLRSGCSIADARSLCGARDFTSGRSKVRTAFRANLKDGTMPQTHLHDG